MASTLTKILIHITFSTKHREPSIPQSHESDLFSYIGGICRAHGSPLLAMNGVPDHVHMLVSLGKMATLADLLRDVKSDSSKWIKTQGTSEFAWQTGYFAFSIGESGVEGLRRYITGQKERHATISFQDEIRALLRKYQMDLDETFMWD